MSAYMTVLANIKVMTDRYDELVPINIYEFKWIERWEWTAMANLYLGITELCLGCGLFVEVGNHLEINDTHPYFGEVDPP